MLGFMGFWLMFALLAAGSANAHAQQFPAIDRYRETYKTCVELAFLMNAERWVTNGNVRGAVERAFADCRTEENALYTTTANLMAILSRPEQAMLLARASVDQLKVSLKAQIVTDMEQAPRKNR